MSLTRKTDTDYKEVLLQIISEIKTSRIKVAKRINTTVMEMYWTIGENIFEKKLVEGYGSQIVERLSFDLKQSFPDYGFSARNLWDMKRFYERYRKADYKLRQLVAELPWGHNLLLMNKIHSHDELFFYASRVVSEGWTRKVLLNNLKTNLYANSIGLPKVHNFKNALPQHLMEQADEILKSRYNLAFTGLALPIKEIELEKRLLDKVKSFMLELGKGFSFISNQHRLILEGKEYFIDMLFFNRHIKSLIAVELKIGEFEPEYIGKMNFYLSLLDKKERMPDENPSIGIILCAGKSNVEVELALQNVHSPIGVAEYEIEFPKEQIKEILENEIREIKKIK